MSRQHQYSLNLKWTGNTGEGTLNYRSYQRGFIISINNKADLQGSADPSFRGDVTKHNPEELLVAALSSCHMLSYLHLCAEAGIVVTDYSDNATGTMTEDPLKGGFFSEVILNPVVTITDISKKEIAIGLHERANALCFIANSVNFPVRHQAQVRAS
jgi:organic hydroperoxide reductase OsmC/OhrA